MSIFSCTFLRQLLPIKKRSFNFALASIFSMLLGLSPNSANASCGASYTLTITNNACTSTTGSGSYPSGASVAITANAGGGSFTNWTGADVAGVTSTTAASTTFTMPSSNAAITANCTAGATTPTACSITDKNAAGGRLFSVNWTAGSGNGGAGGCKLQYQNASSVWVDLGGTENCDATIAGSARTLPADGWNTTWASAPIRLLRISDSSAMCSFANTPTCSVVAGSATATPTIDEDCNGSWDNVVVLEQVDWSYPLWLVPGMPFNIPATWVGCTPGTFAYVLWSKIPVDLYSDAACTLGLFATGTGYTGLSNSGTVPSITNQNGEAFDITSGACQLSSMSGYFIKVLAPGSWTIARPYFYCSTYY